MSSLFTSDWLRLHQMKTEPPKQAALIPTEDELESVLHDQIVAWTRRQWPVVPFIHARMDKRSTIGNGAPDFTLFLPGGRTLLVECKSKDGQLSDEQKLFSANAQAVGHKVHLVRGYDAFLNLVKEVK